MVICTQHICTTGPLHMLFYLPGMFFPLSLHTSSYLSASHSSTSHSLKDFPEYLIQRTDLMFPCHLVWFLHSTGEGCEVILISCIHLMVFLFMISEQELGLSFTIRSPDPRIKVGQVLFVLWTNENMRKKGKAIHQIASTFYKVTGNKGNFSLLPLFFMFSVILYFVIKEEEKEIIYLPKCPHKHKKHSPIVCPTLW